MKIFIIGKPEESANPFFNEVIDFSRFQFVYENWFSFRPEKNCVILFQWPERIFDWREPTDDQLKEFEKAVKEWRKTAKLIYQVHNSKRHFGMNENFQCLYNIVESNSDYMVHFGHYSKKIFQNKYPEKIHRVIDHPINKIPFKSYSRAEARAKLGISMDKLVMIAPGRVRNFEERELILEAFRFLKSNSKFLIVPRMKYRHSKLDFKGRHFLKKIIDIRDYQEKLWNQFKVEKFHITYEFNTIQELSMKIAASDFVFIPRLDVLNSGLVYLAISFNKPFIGPKIGNITEMLERFNLPGFEINNNSSLKKAINKKILTGKENFSYSDTKIEPFQPKNIAEKWDKLFNQL